jgi:hypothetical protein
VSGQSLRVSEPGRREESSTCDRSTKRFDVCRDRHPDAWAKFYERYCLRGDSIRKVHKTATAAVFISSSERPPAQYASAIAHHLRNRIDDATGRIMPKSSIANAIYRLLIRAFNEIRQCSINQRFNRTARRNPLTGPAIN